MAKVEIYTKFTCPYCYRAKSLLSGERSEDEQRCQCRMDEGAGQPACDTQLRGHFTACTSSPGISPDRISTMSAPPTLCRAPGTTRRGCGPSAVVTVT